MKILLIRHAESEHNILGLWAGVTDSALTSHGVLQTKRLGEHLAEGSVHFTQIYASDLQRASMTAEAVAHAQKLKFGDTAVPEIVQSELLREQSFGSYELTKYGRAKGEDEAKDPISKLPDPDDPAFVDKESSEMMCQRADTFFLDMIQPLLSIDLDEPQTVAIVSHGIFLSTFWRKISQSFKPGATSFGPEIPVSDAGWWSPRWGNTGYLEIDLIAENHLLNLPQDTRTETSLRLGHRMHVSRADCRDHLRTLKRTRGIGSETFDPRQKNIEGFFKKAKTEPLTSDPDCTGKRSAEVPRTGVNPSAKA